MKSKLPLKLKKPVGIPKNLGPKVFQTFLIKPNKNDELTLKT